MGISATNVRRGMVIEYDGDRWLVLDSQHVAKGNKRSYMQCKLRNLASGASVNKRLRSADTVEEIFVDKRASEYLYRDASGWIFMDTESYEQFHLDEELLGDVVNYLTPNATVTVMFLDGVATGAELPPAVVLEVTDAEEAIRGDTATNVKKQVTLETGYQVSVPHFIKKGDRLKIDTRSGDFVERSNQ